MDVAALAGTIGALPPALITLGLVCVGLALYRLDRRLTVLETLIRACLPSTRVAGDLTAPD